jgi:UPF0755 protein
VSDEQGFFATQHPSPDDEQRTRRRHLGSCLAVILAVSVLAGGAVFAAVVGMDRIKRLFDGPPDYSGSGAGAVIFEVREGDSSAAIGRNLKDDGVVASVDAFTEAASKDSRSRGIQVGFYEMKKKMSANSALEVLVDPGNLVQDTVTILEGARVRDIVDSIVKHTHIKRRDVVDALSHAESLGLPAEAHGNPEGYLFPATYSVRPDETAKELLSQMVSKAVEVTDSLDLKSEAAKLGLSSEQALTVASILEYEANRTEDYPKVARVIYNRLHEKMALQLDSTVSYASGREGDVWTTAAERASDSRYNTYRHRGLPPGPIGSPGEATIKAALHPADGNWLYFVPDFQHNKTLFTASYKQHLKNVAKAKKYCQTHSEC